MKPTSVNELALIGVAITHRHNRVLSRKVNEMPARLEKQLSLRATELSTQALEAILGRLQGFREELRVSVASLPVQARELARNSHRELEKTLTTELGRKLDSSLTKLAGDCRIALEATGTRSEALFNKRMIEAEKAFGATLEQLAKEYERKRMEMITEFESKRMDVIKESEAKRTELLADTFRGNWDSSVLYRRGETFSFRGGWHLVLKDSRGRLPGKATLSGSDPAYALLAAPGAPGPSTQASTSSIGGGSYVPPPLVAASATQGQWTFSSGYMYWAVADGSVMRWAVAEPPVPAEEPITTIAGVPITTIAGDPLELIP